MIADAFLAAIYSPRWPLLALAGIALASLLLRRWAQT